MAGNIEEYDNPNDPINGGDLNDQSNPTGQLDDDTQHGWTNPTGGNMDPHYNGDTDPVDMGGDIDLEEKTMAQEVSGKIDRLISIVKPQYITGEVSPTGHSVVVTSKKGDHYVLMDDIMVFEIATIGDAIVILFGGRPIVVVTEDADGNIIVNTNVPGIT